MVKKYFYPLQVVGIGATGGFNDETIAKVVSRAGINIDPKFREFGIIFSSIAPKMNVVLNKLVEDGKLVDLLGHTANDLERRRLTGSQFLKFCLSHLDKQKGNPTLVVLTRKDEEVATDLSNVFVAGVDINGHGGLFTDVTSFADDRIWRAGFGVNFVFP